MAKEDFLKLEEFRTIENFNLYEISQYGRVRKLESHMEIKHGYTKDGYHTIKIRKENGDRHIKRIHKLVIETFFGKTDNYQAIDHLDGNIDNNNISNLEYCTHSKNLIRSYKNGRPTRKGLPRKKYTDEVITKVCILLQKKEFSTYGISDKLNVPRSLVKDIKSRKTHKVLSRPYTW
jgi:hypothetical protein